jgi:RimJ/RimL family protein N-acetyltransferase
MSRSETVLQTARLRLRPLTATDADVDAWVELHADPRVNEFVGAYSREQAAERLRAVERQWAERGHGLFAVESLADGRFLGRSGLQYWAQWGEVEAAWVYRFDAHGHGYATEAATAFLDWGRRTLGIADVTSMIDPRNAASIRVAERLGFTLRGTEQRFGHEVLLYGLTRDGTPPRPPTP